MTTRDLLNKVLRGLRQFSLLIDDAITTTSDDYILMILQLLNESKEECEENGWPWMSLRQTVTVTLAASTPEYTLTTAGAADIDTNDRSRLLYENVTIMGTQENFRNTDRSLPQVFDVTDAGAANRLTEITQERMERFHFQDSDETGKPTYFALWHDGSSLKLKIWPTPNSVYSLKIRFYIPQVELTATNLDTVLTIPSRPVWLGALLKANAERGEEAGRPGGSLERAFLDALGSATGREMTKADTTVYLEN